jgi:AraC-like DNA-binding protein
VLVWASFCFSPFAYLYVRAVLSQSYKLEKTDALLFLPALLSVVNHIPFYVLPSSAKLEYLLLVANDKKLIAKETEGMLPAGWMIWARVLLGVATTSSQFYLLARWKRKTPVMARRSAQNSTLYSWMMLFSLIMAIFFGLIILEFLFHFSQSANQDVVIILTISATIFFVCISLLVRPAILYGMTGWLQQQQTSEIQAASNQLMHDAEKVIIEVEQRTSLSVAQGIAFKLALEKHFETNQPFLKAGYTMAELSNEIAIPAYLLSAFINQQYGKNFNELVNTYRVHYFSSVLKNNPEYLQFTMEALGKMAGFNSRSAFIASVKKHTGSTPTGLFGKKVIEGGK